MNDETSLVAPPETAVPITPTTDGRPQGGEARSSDAPRPLLDAQPSALAQAATPPPAGEAPPGEADPGDTIGLALAAYEQLDWQALGARDPAAAAVMWAAYLGLRAKDAGPRREAADPAPAAAQPEREREAQATEDRLAREVPGWSPQLKAQLASFGQSQGFSTQEIADIEDPRAVKVLQLAMIGQAALAQIQRGEQARRFEHIRPPTQVSGQGGAPGGLSDRQGPEAWMETRRIQLKQKAVR